MIGVWLWALTGWMQQTGQRLEIPEIGFSLRFPSAWNVRNQGVEPLAAVAELPPRQAVAMIARSPEGAKGLGVEDALAGIRKSFREHEVLQNEEVTLGPGLKGRLLAVRGQTPSVALRHITYLFTGFGERFSVSFATEEARYPALDETFREIMASLALTGPVNHAQTQNLLEAVAADPVDYEALERLAAEGADVNGVNIKGVSALQLAVLGRKGKLVKWLLDHGADLENPRNNPSLLNMIATPPIRALFKARQAPDASEAAVKRSPPPAGGLEIQWTSPEAELFAGIKDGRIEYVRSALAKGVDLQALEPNYRLPPLALTRRLMDEFKALDLDASKFEPIEALLAEAVETQGE